MRPSLSLISLDSFDSYIYFICHICVISISMGYIYPTPIQASTIPVALLGRDICGCAATGTGKTAAYMLPTVERLLYRPMNNKTITRVLVLVPTRELGAQVYQVTKQLCQFTTIDAGLAIGCLDVRHRKWCCVQIRMLSLPLRVVGLITSRIRPVLAWTLLR